MCLSDFLMEVLGKGFSKSVSQSFNQHDVEVIIVFLKLLADLILSVTRGTSKEPNIILLT